MNLPAPPLSVAEVGGYLGVSDDVVRDLLRKKLLRGSKVGGQWRILPKDLAEYMLETFERPCGSGIQQESKQAVLACAVLPKTTRSAPLIPDTKTAVEE